MMLKLLSRRHRSRSRAVKCDCCPGYGLCASFDYENVQGGSVSRGTIDVCAGCLREGLRIATQGRKRGAA